MSEALQYYNDNKHAYAVGIDPRTESIEREVPFVNPVHGESVDVHTVIGVGNSIGFDVVKFLAGYDEATGLGSEELVSEEVVEGAQG